MSAMSTQRGWFVAIEGVIGVGKTTLARLLREELGAGLLLEVFEENPFLSSFYADRSRYAFQTQMFFLLSRYRQQQGVGRMLAGGPLISDYTFAKDQLFAQLNLGGDEWEMYQRIHHALAEQIPVPDLILFLQADTDVLMARIVQRDRPYERDMDREYIESLRLAYEAFAASYREAPVLVINCNELDWIARPPDLRYVMERLRAVIQDGTYQRTLPDFGLARLVEGRSVEGRPLSDWQQYHVALDHDQPLTTDPFINFLGLGRQVGELGSEFAQWWARERDLAAQGHPPPLARHQALEDRRLALAGQMAKCLTYLLRLANDAEIDLESACLDHLRQSQNEADQTLGEAMRG